MKDFFLIGFLSLEFVAMARADRSLPRKEICLATHNITSSQPSQDEKSILFVMHNGDRWRNDLRGRCNGISFEPFSWVLTGNDDICEDGQTLTVLGGGICTLGKFTKLSKAGSRL